MQVQSIHCPHWGSLFSVSVSNLSRHLGRRFRTPREGFATILVVDDNEDDREIYSRILYYNNFDVVLAPNAVEAVRTARIDPPAAILMDVNLGDISGLAAASFIRQDPALHRIPIICFSSFNISLTISQQSGCNAFLRKPVPAGLLVSTIRRALEESQVDAAPGTAQPP